jgi:hypothetical protein
MQGPTASSLTQNGLITSTISNSTIAGGLHTYTLSGNANATSSSVLAVFTGAAYSVQITMPMFAVVFLTVAALV